MLDFATDHPDDDPADVEVGYEPAEIVQDEEPGELTADAFLDFLILHARYRALWPLEAVAEATGEDIDSVASAAITLVGDGLAEEWAEGPSIILSAFSASAHGLRLSIAEDSPDRWRWVGASEGDAPFKSAKSPSTVLETDLTRGCKGEPRNRLDHLPDRKVVSPDRLVSRGEASNGSPDPPRPVILLGYWLPWPVQRMTSGCPGCTGWRERQEQIRGRARAVGRKHTPSPAMCLACDWYSHQHLIPDRIAREVERSKRGRGGAVYVRDERGLRGGIGA